MVTDKCFLYEQECPLSLPLLSPSLPLSAELIGGPFAATHMKMESSLVSIRLWCEWPIALIRTRYMLTSGIQIFMTINHDDLLLALKNV